ncbi:MAG TPA: glycosyltransferase, partial [Sedimentisphaerales bacterium]|nr:glycosyltransferase [Sedimentisphaerales bacterium]
MNEPQQQKARGRLGIIVYGYNRPQLLRNLLESLRRQGATDNVHVWLDGHASRPALKGPVEQCRMVVKKEFPWAALTPMTGNMGIEKMMIDGLGFMAERYERIIVLEDDCFPVAGAIAELEKAIEDIESRPEVYSVYGHYFLTAAEGETITRFQGWGWGTTRQKLLPVLSEIRKCFLMAEPDYLAWAGKNLTPEVIRRLNVTPGRNCLPGTTSHFCWDDCTCLITAIFGLSHKKTARRVIYNCGIDANSMHFQNDDRFRRAPFNMIGPNEVWDYYEASSRQPQQQSPQSAIAGQPSGNTGTAAAEADQMVVDGILFTDIKRTRSENNSMGFSDKYILKIEHEKHPRKFRDLSGEIEIIKHLNSKGCVSCPRLLSDGTLKSGERYYIQQRVITARPFSAADMIFSILEQKSLGVCEADFRKDNFIFAADGVCYIIDYDQALCDERFKAMGNIEYLEWYVRYMQERWVEYGLKDFYKWGGYDKDEIFGLFRNDSFDLAGTTLFREQITTNTESGIYHSLKNDRIYIEGCRDLDPRRSALDNIEFRPGERVLDVGCNMGLLCHYLHDKGCQATGIDMDPKIVVGAKMVANILGKDIAFAHLDLDDGMITEDYDTICFFSVIHHVKKFREVTENVTQRCSRIILECALHEHGSKPVDGGWANTSGWDFETVQELIAYLETVFAGFKLHKYHGSVDRNRHIISIVKEKMPAKPVRECPRITLVTPSFNQAEYLEQCLCSVIEQGYPNLEYIVIDGGSTDGSVDIIKKYSSHLAYWVSEPDQGQYHAIMKGFARSSGRIMGWLNSDDMLHGGALAIVGDIMRDGSPVEWLTGSPTIRDSRGRTVIVNQPQTWCRARFLSGDYKWIQQESTFWTRSLWDRSGGRLDTRYSYAADMELWFRFFRHARLFAANVLLGGFRFHGDQKTGRALEKYLDEAEQMLASEAAQFLKGKDGYLPPAQPIITFDRKLDRFVISEAEPAQSEVDKLLSELPRKGQELAKAGMLSEALQRFLALVPHKAGAAELYNIIGSLYQAAGHLPAAQAAFRRTLEIDPGNAAAGRNAGVLAAAGSHENKQGLSAAAENKEAGAGAVVSVTLPRAVTPENFDDFTFSRISHGGRFRESSRLEPDSNLKAYQDLLVMNFMLDNVPPGSKLLEIGGGDSRIIAALERSYECWNIDKLEGRGNGPVDVKARGYRLIRDYMGNFSRELPENYFDVVFSISALEHVPEDEQTFENICLDIDRVLKVGGYSLHCFDVVLKTDAPWTNKLMPFMFERYRTLNRFVPLQDLCDDPDLWAMSEAEYNRTWRFTTRKSYREHGKPASYNVLWQKQPDAAHLRHCPAELEKCVEQVQHDHGSDILVSAIVSTYKSEKRLAECLEDLERQTIADRLEIIVVDSGSPENEGRIVREFQQRYSNIKYIRTDERESVYQAWNRGIKAAAGKYITNANTDDRHRHDALEIMTQALDANPDKVLVYAKYTGVREVDGARVYYYDSPTGPYSHEVLLEGKCLVGPQPMWRRSIHEKCGYFDESLLSSGDVEFWLRMAQHYDLLFIDDALGEFLENQDSICHQDDCAVSCFETTFVLTCYRKAAERGVIIGEEGLTGSQHEFVASWYAKDLAKRNFAVKLGRPVEPIVVAVEKIGEHAAPPRLSAVVCAGENQADLQATLAGLAASGTSRLEVVIVGAKAPDAVKSCLAGLAIDATIVQMSRYLGLPLARNTGAEYARGQFLAFIDAGVVPQPEWAATVAAALESGAVAAVRGRLKADTNIALPQVFDLGDSDEHLPCVLETPFCCAVNREIFEKTGGFNALSLAHEGTELAFRIYQLFDEAGRVLYRPDIIASLRPTAPYLVQDEAAASEALNHLYYRFRCFSRYYQSITLVYPWNSSESEADFTTAYNACFLLSNVAPNAALRWAERALELEPLDVKGCF